ncbi:hypothetical protein WA1_35950 [Scytonema hofmannii PCC 7110]|uniref:Uncharacterized protein n=1 Tax=Scytonema hofmannii PCC 7110 TaxID=128403 RepID=A0A139X1J7_9CYAN|nr:hypothetical protein WA1_35950 [Scytonema hofmannii PCC 7110]
MRPSFVGYGSAADGDEARAELWIPLWSAPTGLRELQLLFNEGRAKVGRKTARDAIDFARAISSRGVVRGIDEFIRYGFQVRNGLSYFAIPLGRFQPKLNPKVDRLVELDFWLAFFQSAASDAKAPASVRRVHRVLQTALFEFSLGKRGLLDVLIALGEVEAVLNRSLKFIEEKSIPPLPSLKSTWVKDCDDSSVEFRLALALASRGLRQRLVQVRQDKEKHGKLVWVKERDGKTTWHNGSLIDNLIDLLQREDLEREQKEKQQAQSSDSEDEDELVAKSNDDKSTKSQDKNLVTVALDDIVRWIWGEVDDARVEAIARGLSLVKMYRRCLKKSDSLPVPAAYTLVKVTHHRALKKELLHRVLKKNFSKDVSLPRVPALLNQLASGDCLSATELATRRLHASGFNPAIERGIYESPEKTRRIAASLVFPISEWDVVCLLNQICEFEQEEDR